MLPRTNRACGSRDHGTYLRCWHRAADGPFGACQIGCSVELQRWEKRRSTDQRRVASRLTLAHCSACATVLRVRARYLIPDEESTRASRSKTLEGVDGTAVAMPTLKTHLGLSSRLSDEGGGSKSLGSIAAPSS
jgi:hypothetical protein